jgi:hypothetical protein
MITDDEKALGDFVRRHEVDNARRGRVAAGGLAVGVAASIIAVPLLIATFERTEGVMRGLLPGLVLGVALVGLWAGIANGVRYLSRNDETFRVREGGLVYSYAEKTRIIPWDDIENVQDNGQENALWRSLGWNVNCRIKIKTGGRLHVSGYFHDARGLVDTMQAAVNRGVRPRPPRQQK